MSSSSSHTPPFVDAVSETELSPERREALRKIAAWTPPVMLTLLLSPRPSAASVVNEAGGDAPPPDNGWN